MLVSFTYLIIQFNTKHTKLVELNIFADFFNKGCNDIFYWIFSPVYVSAFPCYDYPSVIE